MIRKEGSPGVQPRVHLRNERRQATILETVPGAKNCSRRPASSPRINQRGRTQMWGPPANCRGAASNPILKTELFTVRFGGLSALTPSQFLGPAGRNPRHHRTERRRQEHLFQLPDRGAAADLGPHRVQRRRYHRPSRRTRSRRRASRAPTRSPISCRTPPPWKTCGSRPSRAAMPGTWSRTTPLFSNIREGRARSTPSAPVQSARTGGQSLARRAAQSRNRHRARHRADVALPR